VSAHRVSAVGLLHPGEMGAALAASLRAAGFDGIFVDANAVSPATARAIGASFQRFVDGAVIGPPPSRPGTTPLAALPRPPALVPDDGTAAS
jgi:hypothetical protein